MIASAARRLIPIALIAWLVYSAVKYPILFVTFGMLGLAHGAMYALIGLGFATTYNIGRFINFSHGDVFMIGAVSSTWLCVTVLEAVSPEWQNVPSLLVSILLAVVVCAALSLAAEVLVFSRLRGSVTFVAVVASVGVALMLQNLAIKWNGSGPKKFRSVIPEVGIYTEIHTVYPHVLATLAISVPTLIIAVLFLTKSQFGRAIRAVSDDPDAARLMGIDVTRMIRIAFIFAGVCAGVAGAIYAQEYRVVSYAIGLKIGLIAYASAIIGGVSRVSGTIFGGLLIGLIESLNAWLPSGLSYKWNQTVIFSVMILMLIYKPQGIMGSRTTERL